MVVHSAGALPTAALPMPRSLPPNIEDPKYNVDAKARWVSRSRLTPEGVIGTSLGWPVVPLVRAYITGASAVSAGRPDSS